MTDSPKQRIRFWRKRRKVTLETLASNLGTSAGHLHKWETGKVAINIDRLSQISDVLGVRLHDLIVDPRRVKSVPVIGMLDRAGNVRSLQEPDTGKPPMYVDAADGIEVGLGAAIEVANDALQPIPNGWLLFFHQESRTVSNRAVGGLSVVKSPEHTLPMVRRLGPGSDEGLYNLFSPHATEILDVQLEWAAPIISVRPLYEDEEYP